MLLPMCKRPICRHALVLLLTLVPVLLRAQSTTHLVSAPASGTEANGNSVFTAVSADGGTVVFATSATNMLSVDENGRIQDVVARDLEPSATTLISKSSTGRQGDGASGAPAVSADGARIAFESEATNLVSPDANAAVSDVFLHDRTTGLTTLVSVSTSGQQGDGPSTQPAISEDGRFVVFLSAAQNLRGDRPDRNAAVADAFLRDTLTGTTTIASVNDAGDQVPVPAIHAVVSRDGRFVAFASEGLYVANDTNGLSDIYLRDLQAGTTTLITKGLTGNAANGASGFPALDAAGSRLAFTSTASNLIAGDWTALRRVYVHDLAAGTFHLVSRSTSGEPADVPSETPSLSPDGRFVAFTSASSRLVAADANRSEDLFLHDLSSGETSRVSAGVVGVPDNYTEGNAASSSGFFVVSREAKVVAFRSRATNLAASGPTTLNRAHIYARRQANRDTTAPVLTCPAATIAALCTSAQGAPVEYQVTAADGHDGAPPVTCDHPSGSLFPPGTTLVTCTAVDMAGNLSTCSFDVTVSSSDPLFLRGDANMDARLNISDAIFTLHHLFRGGEPPPCGDAADANDDGALTLTDPLVLLVYLFQQGPPLAAPGTLAAGIDPTADGLACRAPTCADPEDPAGAEPDPLRNLDPGRRLLLDRVLQEEKAEARVIRA
jgi:Tol biopolymer transport system component